MDVYRNTSAKSVVLLGASLRTGNLGVTAITESTIQHIWHLWPDAVLTIIGNNAPEPPVEHITVSSHDLRIPVHKYYALTKRLGNPDHILNMALARLGEMTLPGRHLDNRKSPILDLLMRADLVLDASSGDGFTDLYGYLRFYREAVRKLLVLLLGRRLVLLPQTLGPFRNPLVRAIAISIIKRSYRAYVRDAGSLALVRRYERVTRASRAALVPDLAFAHNSPGLTIKGNPRPRTPVIAMNISGLLLNPHTLYDIGLQSRYREIIDALIEEFSADSAVSLVLVPHVMGSGPESDQTACASILAAYQARLGDRITVGADQSYSIAGIKRVIAGCDFFVGARMHACIAALTCHVPALGLAYSDKFAGVFQTVGLGDCVADLRTSDPKQVVALARVTYRRRDEITLSLVESIRDARHKVAGSFSNISLEAGGD